MTRRWCSAPNAQWVAGTLSLIESGEPLTLDWVKQN